MPRHANARSITSPDQVKQYLLPVLVGGDILTYSYAREFHRAYGVEKCIVLATQEIKMLSESRLTDYRLCPDLYEEPERMYATLEQIAAEFPEKTLLLLGSDDVHARLFSQGKQRLEAAGFVVPYIDFDLLDDITQKERFYELCEELDIPYPQTWYLDFADENVSIDANSFPYPLIAKPSNSARFQEASIAHKKKIYEVDTPEEMQRIFDSIKASDYDKKMVIQDFIPGGDEFIHTLTTFSDAEGNALVGAGGTVCLQDHDPTALGNPLCIMGEQVPEIFEAGKKLLKKVGYHGFANFDIKYDSRDGSYRFFEVNTRCGRNTYYMSLGGVNFVTLFVRDWILGESIEPTYAGKPFLYCCVPSYVLKRSMPEGPIKAECLKRYKATGKSRYPLHYGPDTAKHGMWASAMYLNQIPKFKRFYWDTNGKQLDI